MQRQLTGVNLVNAVLLENYVNRVPRSSHLTTSKNSIPRKLNRIYGLCNGIARNLMIPALSYDRDQIDCISTTNDTAIQEGNQVKLL